MSKYMPGDGEPVGKTRRERERELGPGLHKVGPEPYDYVYNPEWGQKVSFIGTDGKMVTGHISVVYEDDETGEMRLTVEPLGESEKRP